MQPDPVEPGSKDPAASQALMQSSFIGMSGGISAIPEAEKAQFEEEKLKLYQQLDDKVGLQKDCFVLLSCRMI